MLKFFIQNNFHNKGFRHALTWCLITIYFYYVNSMEGSKMAILGFAILFTGNTIISYYAIIATACRFMLRKKNLLTFMLFILSFAQYFALDLLNFKILFPILLTKTSRDGIPLSEFINLSLSQYMYIFIVAYATSYSKVSIIHSQQSIERKKMQLSRQLGIFKHQFHSHLNYNFIYYCYGLLLKVSRQKAEITGYYSDMLAHALRTHDKTKVSLKSEINYLNDFIGFQSFFINPRALQFEVKIDSNQYEISPMLLGTLLEQAYKYGQLHNPEQTLKAVLYVINGNLEFSIICFKNDKSSLQIDPKTIEQLIQFLELRYPQSYTLETIDLYTSIHLKLNLQLNV